MINIPKKLNKQGPGRIDWTDFTWNPIKGKCKHTCEYCYMQRYFNRFKDMDRTVRLDKGSSTLPFTKENISQFFENLFVQRNELFKEGIADLFNEITSYHNGNNRHTEGWKTNKNWKINKKIIVDWGVEYTDYGKYRSYGDTRPSYGSFRTIYGKDWLDDLDKIVRKIKEFGVDGFTIRESLNSRFQQLGNVYVGEKFDNTCETPYFHLKFFKKGTLHITFKDEKILEELNLIGAKLRRDLGYDDYGKKTEV